MAIRERFQNFEHRIEALSDVDLEEDETKNCVKFYIRAELYDPVYNNLSSLEVGTAISRMSQEVEEG